MRSIDLQTSPDSSKVVASLVGIDYEEMNCWDLVRQFYFDMWGIRLKHYFEEMPSSSSDKRNLIYSGYGDFIEVEENELVFGDVIIFKIRGIENHIGVYIGDQRFIHSSKGIGSCTERLKRWAPHIANCRRLIKANA